MTFRGPGQKLRSNILDHMLMIQEHLAETDERRVIFFEIYDKSMNFYHLRQKRPDFCKFLCW